MNKSESDEIIWRKEDWSASERKKISLEKVLDIQIKLSLVMIRGYVDQSLIEDAKNNSAFDEALFMRYAEKYAFEHNGLDKYCGDKKADAELLLRLQSGTYTEADLVELSNYMQSSELGKFFENSDEARDFVMQYVTKH